MGRRVDDRQQAVLLRHDRVDLRRKVLDVEIVVRIEELVVRQMRAALVADDVVGAPEPVGRQDLIATLRIVGHSVMDGTRATRRRDGTEVALRLLVGKRQVNDSVEVLRKPRDWRIARVILDGQRAEDALHRRDARELAVLVHHDAHRRIRDLVGAILLCCLAACCARTKNRILQSLARCMRSCHTRRHKITSFHTNQYPYNEYIINVFHPYVHIPKKRIQYFSASRFPRASEDLSARSTRKSHPRKSGSLMLMP